MKIHELGGNQRNTYFTEFSHKSYNLIIFSIVYRIVFANSISSSRLLEISDFSIMVPKHNYLHIPSVLFSMETT